jgi:hypothetical protein
MSFLALVIGACAAAPEFVRLPTKSMPAVNVPDERGPVCLGSRGLVIFAATSTALISRYRSQAITANTMALTTTISATTSSALY